MEGAHQANIGGIVGEQKVHNGLIEGAQWAYRWGTVASRPRTQWRLEAARLAPYAPDMRP